MSSHSRVLFRTARTFAIAAFCFLVIQGSSILAAPAPLVEAPHSVELPASPKAPVIDASCTFTKGAVTKFTLQQTEGKKEKLLDITFKRCRLLVDASMVRVAVDVQVELNLAADVSSCSAFQIGELFEGRIDSERLQWTGFRRLVSSFPIADLDGDKRDLGYFPLHEQTLDQPVILESLFLPQLTKPSYPEFYWGTTYLLEEDRTGQLATAIRNSTPISSEAKDGAADLKVELSIEPYPPRGWCIAREPTGGKHNAILHSP